MLTRRGRREERASASYAVVWASLRKQFSGRRTILVTAGSASEDASIAAAALAETAVRLEGGRGLVLVLQSATASRRMSNPSNPSIRVIAAVSPADVRLIVAERGDEVGFTIVVCPPPQHAPDCVAVATVADAAVLVARSGRTRFGEAQEAAELLRQAGVSLAAAVLLTGTAARRANGLEPGESDQGGIIAEIRPRAEVQERREAPFGPTA